MGSGSGYGKVILFNEHFVVHGVPAIVSAIDKKTVAHISRGTSPPFTIDDQRPELPRHNKNEHSSYKREKAKMQKDSIHRIANAMGVDLHAEPIHIRLGGDLVAASGIGASAASCVAIARALAEHKGHALSNDRINEIAYEGEKAYHGTPSGIDNTASTYGGLIWFLRRPEGNLMERLRMPRPVEVVMGSTLIVANTKVAVELVKKRKENEPDFFSKTCEDAYNLAHQGRAALLRGDFGAVGRLMNKNHELLQCLGVSCEELDHLVEIARSEGAIGAKLTGGGLGGFMVALTPGRDCQERVARAIEREGYYALRTKIGI